MAPPGEPELTAPGASEARHVRVAIQDQLAGDRFLRALEHALA